MKSGTFCHLAGVVGLPLYVWGQALVETADKKR